MRPGSAWRGPGGEQTVSDVWQGPRVGGKVDQGTVGDDGMTEPGDYEPSSVANNWHGDGPPRCHPDIPPGAVVRGNAKAGSMAAKMPLSPPADAVRRTAADGRGIGGNNWGGDPRVLVDPQTGKAEPVEQTKGPVRPEAIVNAQRYSGWKVDEFIADLDLGFRLGNVVKYISRAGKKVGCTTLDDLRKARVYLDRHIKRLEDGQK